MAEFGAIRRYIRTKEVIVTAENRTFRDGMKAGIVLSLKMLETTPIMQATKSLTETYKKLETLVDENGESLTEKNPE
jgi:hypothetical protein